MAKSGTKLGPVDLSSFSIVFSFQETIFSCQEYIFSCNRPCLVFRCIPWYRNLVAKIGTQLGPINLSSDVPPLEASSGQEWY